MAHDWPEIEISYSTTFSGDLWHPIADFAPSADFHRTVAPHSIALFSNRSGDAAGAGSLFGGVKPQHRSN